MEIFFRSQISIAVESLSSLIGDAVQPQDTASGRQKPANPALVFVIHGRQLLGDFHDFCTHWGLSRWNGRKLGEELVSPTRTHGKSLIWR
jgi:hypothetical protein